MPRPPTPEELRERVAPGHTALVTQECQISVLGAAAVFPALAEIARKAVIPNLARLARAAREADVPVVHCVAARRPDGRGSSRNAALFRHAARRASGAEAGGEPDGGATAATRAEGSQVIPELGPEPEDLVLPRLHGVGPMGGTDLAAVLRNLGVSTIVAVGVSLNIGMVSFATDAVNQGFELVLPRDAVCGLPEDYGEAMLRNTYSWLATLVTSQELLAAWR